MGPLLLPDRLLFYCEILNSMKIFTHENVFLKINLTFDERDLVSLTDRTFE